MTVQHRVGAYNTAVGATPPSSATVRLAFLVGAIVLIGGFGDGIGYALAALTGQRSPWEFLLPVIAIPLLLYLRLRGPNAIAPADTVLIVGFAAFSGLVFLIEWRFVGDFYFLGLAQLLAFLLVLITVRAIFSSGPAWLDRAFRRSLSPIHFFLCGYVVLAYAALHLLCIDLSVLNVLTGSGARGSDYYGFRPSGFSREPQWTAIALAASYTGVHYLAPSKRLLAFAALLAASAAVGSATGMAFVAAVVIGFVAGQIRTLRGHKFRVAFSGPSMRARITPAVVLTVAIATAGAIGAVVIWETGANGCALPPAKATTEPISPVGTGGQSASGPGSVQSTGAQLPLGRLINVITGRDPSTSMRVVSSVVALRVIDQSFPLGVGYGNFRRFAVYPSAYDAYFQTLDPDSSYKSDSFVLNYTAELGVLGLLLVGGIALLLVSAGRYLQVVFLGMVAMSGTILLPPVLAMAAVIGLLARERSRSRETDNLRTPDSVDRRVPK